jgi:hypothetical protein
VAFERCPIRRNGRLLGPTPHNQLGHIRTENWNKGPSEHPAMRRLNFRLRTLLMAVALAALLLWGGMLAIRSATYAFFANGVAKKQAAYQADILAMERRAAKGLTPKEAAQLAFGHRMMEYLARQQARYERAARSPWLPTKPDPLPPR